MKNILVEVEATL